MRLSNNKLIGITGGIGSGKSMASCFLASFMRLPLIDIDKQCARLLEKGNAGWLEIRNEFGNAFFNHDNQLERKKLRTAIFSDPELRLQINNILHPLAFNKMVEDIKQCPGKVVLVDVPLLFEAGWEDYFDHRVVVYADDVQCCQRIVRRDGIDPDEARRTILSQIPLVDKVLRADHVINNSGCRISSLMEIIHLARLITPGAPCS